MLTLGLSLYAPGSPSDAVTAVLVPSGMDAGKIIKHVWEKQGVKVADGAFRPVQAAVAHVLSLLGLDGSALGRSEIRNSLGEPVGELRIAGRF